MLKNTTTNSYRFLIVIVILFVPGNLHAQWERLVPKTLNFQAFIVSLLPLFIKFWPLVVIVIAALIKMWLLKRKLSIPWKWKSIEKLSMATLAETIVELFFLSLIMFFFAPAVSSVLSDIQFLANASANIKFVIHVVVVIPYYCFISAILILLLINFISAINLEQQWRQYFKYGAFLAAIVPGLLIIVFFAGKIFAK